MILVAFKMDPDTDLQDENQNVVTIPRIGCQHYARKCSFISPCCKKEYTCRVCHDDNELHSINRQEVQQIKCLKCNLIQKVQRECEGCRIEFGKYFCGICRLYDDEDKGQFHCDPCGLCRVGGRDQFFHCEKCDMCLSIDLKNKHKCVVESSRRNCAVCLEDLHTSRMSANIPPCGHLIHGECYRQCIRTGNYACPTCNRSLVDMKSVWKHLDDEIAHTPMPDEYKDFKVQILCRDCHKESKVIFHVIGLKCAYCGSYNTCRSGENEEPPELLSNAQTSTDTQDQDGSRAEAEGVEEAEGGYGAWGGDGDEDSTVNANNSKK